MNIPSMHFVNSEWVCSSENRMLQNAALLLFSLKSRCLFYPCERGCGNEVRAGGDDIGRELREPSREPSVFRGVFLTSLHRDRRARGSPHQPAEVGPAP